MVISGNSKIPTFQYEERYHAERERENSDQVLEFSEGNLFLCTSLCSLKIYCQFELKLQISKGYFCESAMIIKNRNM